MRQSGLVLTLGGVIGAAFFLATDPRFTPAWSTRIGWVPNMVDATTHSICGTLVGLAGSVAIISTGIWLTVRRSI